jgi:hypothetical protein
MGLALNVVAPLLFLGLGYIFSHSAFEQQQNLDVGLILVILLAVSFSERGVIWILKKKWLANFAPFPAIQAGAQLPAQNPEKSAHSFALVVYSLCLTPSIYGLAYFLLGGSLNWFVLFIAITLLGFLLFKPKEEELKKFFKTESSTV